MTTKPKLSQLVAMGGPSLSDGRPQLSPALRAAAGGLGQELLNMLTGKNGFYAFESALHVFPSGHAGDEITLEAWNSPGLWRTEYQGLADDCLFFAEDVFGSQFCIHRSSICSFDPETGTKVLKAATLEEWARDILGDPAVSTGYTLAHEWQRHHGPLPPNHRLFAKYPFVVGGDYAISNLRCIDSVAGMRFLGSIATQIHSLPDGTKIDFEIVD